MKPVYIFGGLAGIGIFLFAASQTASASPLPVPCGACGPTDCAPCCNNGVFGVIDMQQQSQLTLAIAQGIAVGEGYSGTLPDGSRHTVNPASKGTRFNNPGDIFHNGKPVTYTTVADGWVGLYDLINRIFTGSNPSYDLSSNMLQFAATYTADKDPSPELTGWFNALQSACERYGFTCTPDMTMFDFWNQNVG